MIRDNILSGKTIAISLQTKTSTALALRQAALAELGLPSGLAAMLLYEGKPLRGGDLHDCLSLIPEQLVTLTLSAPSLLGGAQAQISTAGQSKVAPNTDSDDTDDHYKRAGNSRIVQSAPSS